MTSRDGLVQLPCPKHSQHRLHRASRVSSVFKHGGSTAPTRVHCVAGFVCTHGKECFLLCLTVTSCNSVWAHVLYIFTRHCWEWCNTNQPCPCSALGSVGRQTEVRRERQNLDGLSHNLLCRSHPSVQHHHEVTAI